MPIVMNFRDVEPAGGFEPLPPGTYMFQVVGAELYEPDDPDKYPGFKLESDVIEGEYAGRKLFHFLSSSPKAASFTLSALLSMGFSEEALVGAEAVEIEAEDLLGCEFAARIKIEDRGEYGKQNVVSRYIRPEEL